MVVTLRGALRHCCHSKLLARRSQDAINRQIFAVDIAVPDRRFGPRDRRDDCCSRVGVCDHTCIGISVPGAWLSTTAARGSSHVSLSRPAVAGGRHVPPQEVAEQYDSYVRQLNEEGRTAQVHSVVGSAGISKDATGGSRTSRRKGSQQNQHGH